MQLTKLKFSVSLVIALLALGNPRHILACGLVGDGQNIVVTGLPTGSREGAICYQEAVKWRCHSVETGIHGIVEESMKTPVAGTVWFSPIIRSPDGKAQYGEGCGVVIPPSAQVEPRAWIVTLVTSMVGMLSGFGLAWFTFALTRAARNKELANDWVEEYFWRLREFETSPDVSLRPKALPHLPKSHRRRLMVAVREVDLILAGAGVLTERTLPERRALVAQIGTALESIEPKTWRGRVGEAIGARNQ